MTSVPNLIVFDCDGTLVDSQHLIVQAMRLTFEAAGLATPARADILRTVGLSVPEALLMLAPDQYPDTRSQLARSYREWCMTLRRQPNWEEADVRGRGFPAVQPRCEGERAARASPPANPAAALSASSSKTACAACSRPCRQRTARPSKPHPAMLLQAMEETGAAPETTVMIGDTSYDMIMASCANVTGIGVSWGYHAAADLKRSGAKAVVSSFPALGALLAGRELARNMKPSPDAKSGRMVSGGRPGAALAPYPGPYRAPAPPDDPGSRLRHFREGCERPAPDFIKCPA